MKTILVLTDFSISADYTSQYALALAQQMEANLLVCNIYETPQGQNATEHNRWPFSANKENSINDLGAVVAHLKTRLDMKKGTKSYQPEIEQYSVEGEVGDELVSIMSKRNVILALVSAHSKADFVGMLSKDNAWAIIDNATFPVLVIPYQVRFKPFNDIGIANPIIETGEENRIKHFFEQLPFQITYHHLPKQSLPRDIDLLVIVHHQRNFFQRLFKGSLTRKLATQSNTPLLVFPGTHLTEPANLF